MWKELITQSLFKTCKCSRISANTSRESHDIFNVFIHITTVKNLKNVSLNERCERSWLRKVGNVYLKKNARKMIKLTIEEFWGVNVNIRGVYSHRLMCRLILGRGSGGAALSPPVGPGQSPGGGSKLLNLEILNGYKWSKSFKKWLYFNFKSIGDWTDVAYLQTI
jgi:hypothetical protein